MVFWRCQEIGRIETPIKNATQPTSTILFASVCGFSWSSSLLHFSRSHTRGRTEWRISTMKDKRKGISKKTRFAIFARDGFTCRYCGSQSDKVQLVIDHIMPVCQGGTNDETNLITSCFACNSGKGGDRIDQCAPSEIDRLRIHQEISEQAQIQEKFSSAAKRHAEFRQQVCNHICEIFEWETVEKAFITTVCRAIEVHGTETVSDWLNYTSSRIYGDTEYSQHKNAHRYFCGILRNNKKETV